jgi:hypothetical protein
MFRRMPFAVKRRTWLSWGSPELPELPAYRQGAPNQQNAARQAETLPVSHSQITKMRQLHRLGAMILVFVVVGAPYWRKRLWRVSE